jgi:hypothetical protein
MKLLKRILWGGIINHKLAGGLGTLGDNIGTEKYSRLAIRVMEIRRLPRGRKTGREIMTVWFLDGTSQALQCRMSPLLPITIINRTADCKRGISPSSLIDSGGSASARCDIFICADPQRSSATSVAVFNLFTSSSGEGLRYSRTFKFWPKAGLFGCA